MCWSARSFGRATVDELKREFPAVTVEHQLVDSMAMHLMNRRGTLM